MRESIAIREDGFSLIEILVSLAIVSLMAGFMVNSISLFRVSENISRDGIQLQETNQALARIAKTIEKIQPIYLNMKGDRLFGLHGENDSLVIVTRSDGAVLTAGNYLVSWSIPDKNAYEYQESWRPITHNVAGDSISAFRQPILDGVFRLTFEYLPPINSHLDVEWLSTWSNKSEMPRAIRITAYLEYGDKKTKSVSRIASLEK